MALKAVRNCVIVKLLYDEKIGSIVVPETAKQYSGSFTGKVVAIGPEYRYDLKVGDKVYFRRHEGHRIRYRGENYLSLRSRWVFAKEVEESDNGLSILGKDVYVV